MSIYSEIVGEADQHVFRIVFANYKGKMFTGASRR